MVSKKLPIKLPRHALTNVELLRYIKILNIPNFRGIFMRNGLPKRIKSKETGIINLDDKNGPGTHWTAYTGCIMKNLWCYNFLIFYPILINDMSNKIALNGLQFELIQYLFLSSVFDK
jgi:hypothetical protein